MRTIGVDPDCVRLARRFLMDDPSINPISDAEAEANLQSLSGDIQQAIEDWFFTHALEVESERMSDYDSWKSRDPACDYWDGEIELYCTCPRELGAGGARKTDRDCPLHGIDPDAEYDRMRMRDER